MYFKMSSSELSSSASSSSSPARSSSSSSGKSSATSKSSSPENKVSSSTTYEAGRRLKQLIRNITQEFVFSDKEDEIEETVLPGEVPLPDDLAIAVVSGTLPGGTAPSTSKTLLNESPGSGGTHSGSGPHSGTNTTAKSKALPGSGPSKSLGVPGGSGVTNNGTNTNTGDLVKRSIVMDRLRLTADAKNLGPIASFDIENSEIYDDEFHRKLKSTVRKDDFFKDINGSLPSEAQIAGMDFRNSVDWNLMKDIKLELHAKYPVKHISARTIFESKFGQWRTGKGKPDLLIAFLCFTASFNAFDYVGTGIWITKYEDDPGHWTASGHIIRKDRPELINDPNCREFFRREIPAIIVTIVTGLWFFCLVLHRYNRAVFLMAANTFELAIIGFLYARILIAVNINRFSCYELDGLQFMWSLIQALTYGVLAALVCTVDALRMSIRAKQLIFVLYTIHYFRSGWHFLYDDPLWNDTVMMHFSTVSSIPRRQQASSYAALGAVGLRYLYAVTFYGDGDRFMVVATSYDIVVARSIQSFSRNSNRADSMGSCKDGAIDCTSNSMAAPTDENADGKAIYEAIIMRKITHNSDHNELASLVSSVVKTIAPGATPGATQGAISMEANASDSKENDIDMVSEVDRQATGEKTNKSAESNKSMNSKSSKKSNKRLHVPNFSTPKAPHFSSQGDIRREEEKTKQSVFMLQEQLKARREEEQRVENKRKKEDKDQMAREKERERDRDKNTLEKATGKLGKLTKNVAKGVQNITLDGAKGVQNTILDVAKGVHSTTLDIARGVQSTTLDIARGVQSTTLDIARGVQSTTLDIAKVAKGTLDMAAKITTSDEGIGNEKAVLPDSSNIVGNKIGKNASAKKGQNKKRDTSPRVIKERIKEEGEDGDSADPDRPFRGSMNSTSSMDENYKKTTNGITSSIRFVETETRVNVSDSQSNPEVGGTEVGLRGIPYSGTPMTLKTVLEDEYTLELRAVNPVRIMTSDTALSTAFGRRRVRRWDMVICISLAFVASAILRRVGGVTYADYMKKHKLFKERNNPDLHIINDAGQKEKPDYFIPDSSHHCYSVLFPNIYLMIITFLLWASFWFLYLHRVNKALLLYAMKTVDTAIIVFSWGRINVAMVANLAYCYPLSFELVLWSTLLTLVVIGGGLVHSSIDALRISRRKKYAIYITSFLFFIISSIRERLPSAKPAWNESEIIILGGFPFTPRQQYAGGYASLALVVLKCLVMMIRGNSFAAIKTNYRLFWIHNASGEEIKNDDTRIDEIIDEALNKTLGIATNFDDFSDSSDPGRKSTTGKWSMRITPGFRRAPGNNSKMIGGNISGNIIGGTTTSTKLSKKNQKDECKVFTKEANKNTNLDGSPNPMGVSHTSTSSSSENQSSNQSGKQGARRSGNFNGTDKT